MKTQKIQENIEETQEKKSLRSFHREAAMTGVEESGNAYQSASLVAAGAGSQGVGVLSALTNLVTALLYLRVPSIIRLLGSRKRATVVLSFLDAISWLPIIVVLLWFRPISPLLLIALWIVNLVPGMLVAAIRNSWLADLTVAGSRGKYLGIRSSIVNAVYLTSFYVMGYSLQRFSGEREYFGFAFIFFISFAATAGSFLTYTRVFEPRGAATEDTSFGFIDFLRETSRRNLGRFILFASLFNFAVYLAFPFFAVYMLRELHFSYLMFAIVSSSELAARALAMTLWGKYADRSGNLRVLGIACFSLPIAPVLWLMSHNAAYLAMAQLFSGAMMAGFELCVVNFIYGTAPPEKRLRYIVYHQTLNRSSMALGTLMGVILLTHITPIMGSKILALFLLSGLLRFAVAATIFPKLREVRKGRRIYKDVSQNAPTLDNVMATGAGLFYRPRQWAQFATQSAVVPVTNVVPTRLGLFYRPRVWQRPAKPLPQASSRNEYASEAALRHGLFYRPRDWTWFSQEPPTVPVANTAKAVTSANVGLFYKPSLWGLLVKQQTPALVANQVVSGTSRGIFHRPTEWAWYAK